MRPISKVLLFRSHRNVWRRHDFVLFETGPHLQHKSALGTDASFSWENDYRHRKIFGLVHFGPLLIRVRVEPVALVRSN